MTWVEVIDSIAKIGLGAVIGGLFSVVALRMNYHNEKVKELRARKVRMVEEAVDVVEKFFNTHANFVSRLSWMVEDAKGSPAQISPETHAQLKERDDLLQESADRAHVAASRLGLLKAHDSYASLKDAIAAIMDFRNGMVRRATLPSSEELRAHQDKATGLKAEVQKQVAELYASF